MGEKLFDYAKIAVIAYLGIFALNRLLKATGLSQFTTSNS